jgi:flagellar M-ring protein FliF
MAYSAREQTDSKINPFATVMAETATVPSPSPLSMAAFMWLSNQQKLAGMIAVSLFIALLIGGFLWTREPDYAVLISIQD